MRIVRGIAELRAARPAWNGLGLVPTMGSLHAGHLSLVERARAACGAAAVSIFVNPTQFGSADDLARYPRNAARDLELLEAAGTDLAFLPAADEIYPPGCTSRVEVGAIAEPLEGASRPGHFTGVATVVLKLLNIVQPTHAFFGQKDAQQCAVIRRMAADLNLPVRIEVAPTVREADGLAMSSRNVQLTPAQRAQAPLLFQALRAAGDAVAAGERDAAALRRIMLAVLAPGEGLEPDYASVAAPDTLREVERVGGPTLLSLAVRLGHTRLIDNLVVLAD